MNASALYLNSSHGSVETLIFEYSELASVNGIGLLCMESRKVEIFRSFSDLFVWCEGNCNAIMALIRICFEVTQHLHYLGDACLVVCTQKRSAVSPYKIFADVFFQFGEIRRREDIIFAVVGMNDKGLYVLS